jgi:hypothetical protein
VSVAERATETPELLYQPDRQVEPLHETVVTGGVVSADGDTEICCERGASWLPATSVDANRTVVLPVTENSTL